ncbi:alpha-glucan family phosphorylase [bacterium]|nr:alpha-glucan family phosphorylase [bacterium]
MKISPLAAFTVVPKLPDSLNRLQELACNYIWSWTPDIAGLFRSLDPALWRKSNHNPMRVIKEVPQKRLEDAAATPEFLEHYHRCLSSLDHYLKDRSWFDNIGAETKDRKIAFFSMEYGLAECLTLYSGGLGVLSGDYLKAASDLGLPVVGIGLAYREGYFQQLLTAEGQQEELYPKNDFYSLPMVPLLDDKGKRLTIHIPFHDHQLAIGAWKVQVGRIPLYVLDTDLEENSEVDRRITHTLYGGDKETRIRQEIVLGFGGVALLNKLGIKVGVCHMNEGHSGFVQIARIIQFSAEYKLTFTQALRLVSAGTLFTTHTPVPAGIDQFTPGLMDKYFSRLYNEVGLSRDDIMALGSMQPGTPGQEFNMAVFALRTSDYSNGVARLHGDVARHMWAENWPMLPHEEIPIEHVTNGIHLRTWVAEQMSNLFDRYLGPEWHNSPDDKAAWSKVYTIPDEELWAAHVQAKEKMVGFCRRRIALHRTRTSGIEMSPEELSHFLDPRRLTIGFARRFATYKRATLFLRYPERLLKILKNEARPVQFVFAGKAHPQDVMGKDLIRDIVRFAKDNGVEDRLVFIENYDMNVARHLVQGVDVWLNTPERPHEASGTSGMKVLGNGGLNLSIMDGWWDEAYSSNVGWAIGRGRQLHDYNRQFDHDARMLYDVVEQQVIPMYYQVDDGSIPRRWVSRMKDSICELVPRFTARRMVKEYCEDYYMPAFQRCLRLCDGEREGVKELDTWRRHLESHWHEVSILKVDCDSSDHLTPGQEVKVKAKVRLGSITSSDIEVQICFGTIDQNNHLELLGIIPMEIESNGNEALFKGAVKVEDSGRFGYTVRVIPNHPLLANPLRMGLVKWAPF